MHDLCKGQTRAEKILCEMLRGRQFDDLIFNQHACIGNYIVDFCCKRLRLIIEVDEGSYVGMEKKDRERDMNLESQGFRIMRFNEEQIIDHPQRVIEEIRRYIKRRLDNNLTLKEK